MTLLTTVLLGGEHAKDRTRGWDTYSNILAIHVHIYYQPRNNIEMNATGRSLGRFLIAIELASDLHRLTEVLGRDKRLPDPLW